MAMARGARTAQGERQMRGRYKLIRRDILSPLWLYLSLVQPVHFSVVPSPVPGQCSRVTLISPLLSLYSFSWQLYYCLALASSSRGGLVSCHFSMAIAQQLRRHQASEWLFLILSCKLILR